MTFYDSEASVPDLPKYEDVLNDCPAFQQSLKYWSQKAGEVGLTKLSYIVVALDVLPAKPYKESIQCDTLNC